MTRTVHVTHWKKSKNVPKKKICDFACGASEIFWSKKGDLRKKAFPFWWRALCHLKVAQAWHERPWHAFENNENVPKKNISDFERGASEIFLRKSSNLTVSFSAERCSTLTWGSAQNIWCDKTACRNEKFLCMGPTRNVFGVGPYIFFVRSTNRSRNAPPTLRWKRERRKNRLRERKVLKRWFS